MSVSLFQLLGLGMIAQKDGDVALPPHDLAEGWSRGTESVLGHMWEGRA